MFIEIFQHLHQISSKWHQSFLSEMFLLFLFIKLKISLALYIFLKVTWQNQNSIYSQRSQDVHAGFWI